MRVLKVAQRVALAERAVQALLRLDEKTSAWQVVTTPLRSFCSCLIPQVMTVSPMRMRFQRPETATAATQEQMDENLLASW
jgi:hypothetical protein